MYKSNLFAADSKSSTNLGGIWNNQRESSVHADVFNLSSSKFLEDLTDTAEDSLRQLEQEVLNFEQAITDIDTTDYHQGITKIHQTYDTYELAHRMTMRLRVLLAENHQLRVAER